MKNRLLSLVLVGVLGVSVLSACGGASSTDAVQSTETEIADDATVDNTDTTDENISEDTSETEEVSDSGMKTLTITDWAYDSYYFLNGDYMLACNDGEKYNIIDMKTGEPTENIYHVSDGFVGYDEVGVGTESASHSGERFLPTFWGWYANEDGTYSTDAYRCYPESFPQDWKAYGWTGVVKYYGSWKDTIIKIIKYKGNDGGLYYGIYQGSNYLKALCKADYCSLIRPSFGWTIVCDDNFHTDWGERGAFGYVLRNNFEIDDDFKIDPNKVNRHYRLLNEDHYAYRILDNAPNSEGWVEAGRYDLDAYDQNGMDAMIASCVFGFYNLESKDFIPYPDGVTSAYKGFMEINYCQKCCVTAGRAALWCKDGEDDKLRIFDLNTGDWANDNLYRYVGEFGFHKYVRVANSDSKWGYIRDDDLTEVGEWYDNVSDFCNGYALVQNGGKMHLIDEDFNVVSEDFDCEGAIANWDYIECYVDDDRPIFYVMLDDGKLHVLTVN